MPTPSKSLLVLSPSSSSAKKHGTKALSFSAVADYYIDIDKGQSAGRPLANPTSYSSNFTIGLSRGEDFKPDSRPSRSIPATLLTSRREVEKLLQNKLLFFHKQMYLVLSYVENAFSSFHDSAPISSAALVGLGGRAVGVKAIGSVDGNGLSWKGRLQASRR